MAKQALVMGIDVGGQSTKLGVVDARSCPRMWTI